MLTEATIRKAIKEASSEITLTDGGNGRGRGSLKLRIRPAAGGASAAWVAAWKVSGQRAKKTLGRYPEMTLAEARAAYINEVSPVLESGKDPRVTVAANGRPTVERMFQAYVAHLKSRRVASADETERVLLRCAGCAADGIGRNRLASSVEPADIAAHLARYFSRGRRGAADKARAYICAAFGWAMKSTYDYTVATREDWGVKSNPAMAVKRDIGARNTRDRNLSMGELVAVWRGADPGAPNWSEETAACVRVLIACGQRVMETLRMEGRDIDLQARLWTMPAEKTKGGKRPHTVPLPDLVAPILASLKAKHGDGYLFRSRDRNPLPHMSHQSVKQAIDRWIAASGAQHFQTRDLRRSWKSRAGELGITKEMRDRIQQHMQHDTGSLHYDRADYLPQMREAMDRWAAWLENHVCKSGITQKHSA